MARQRAEVFGLSQRVRFIQANAERLSQTVPVEKYDLVYSFGVIHHTPRPERVLAPEIAKVCEYMMPASADQLIIRKTTHDGVRSEILIEDTALVTSLAAPSK